jgi:hypothetical protein
LQSLAVTSVPQAQQVRPVQLVPLQLSQWELQLLELPGQAQQSLTLELAEQQHLTLQSLAVTSVPQAQLEQLVQLVLLQLSQWEPQLLAQLGQAQQLLTLELAEQRHSTSQSLAVTLVRQVPLVQKATRVTPATPVQLDPLQR